MINGSDFRTVWARHGKAAAEKISPNAKTRMFVVQPAGRTIITQHDGKVSCAAKLFLGGRKIRSPRRSPPRRACPPPKQQGGVRQRALCCVTPVSQEWVHSR